MVLICLFLCRSSSLPLFFFPSSSSAYAPILISISSIVLRLISSSLFPSRLHTLPASPPLNLAPCLASAGFFMPSAYAPIFIPLRCLSLSFCILNCPYSASFPFLALQLISSRPLLYLIFHFLPASQYRPASPLLLLLSGLYFSAPDVPHVANIVFLPPPLDMAKEAICALLAILEHFFEAFSPLDLFFALAPFRPVPRPFPAFLHPGCRRFPPLPIPFLHRFQPIPSPARPLKSTSSRPGSHPSRRHPPVLSSSSELLSLSASVTLRGRLPSPHRLSLRRLVAIARATTPSASPQAIMSAPAPSTMSPQAARPLVCFCSSRATIFRHLRLPSLSLAALPRLSPLAISCLPLQPLPHLCLPACPFLSAPAATA